MTRFRKFSDNSTYQHKKILVSNHVIEVFEYEKDPYSTSGFENDDYDPFDFENIEIDSRGDRTDERREQTVRDGRNTVRRLALCNFGAGDYFLTLTYPYKKNAVMNDIDVTDKHFKYFMDRLRYHFKTKKIPYVAVREFTKKGNIHYHVLLTIDFGLPSLPKDFGYDYYIDYKGKRKRKYNVIALKYDNDYIKPLEKYIGTTIWKHGFVDVQVLTDIDNIGAYVTKYMTKDISIYFFKNRKIYLCSKGLKRPFVYRDYEADLLLDTYNLGSKKEIFTNSYESEYLGKIIYREYNLMRS